MGRLAGRAGLDRAPRPTNSQTTPLFLLPCPLYAKPKHHYLAETPAQMPDQIPDLAETPAQIPDQIRVGPPARPVRRAQPAPLRARTRSLFRVFPDAVLTRSPWHPYFQTQICAPLRTRPERAPPPGSTHQHLTRRCTRMWRRTRMRRRKRTRLLSGLMTATLTMSDCCAWLPQISTKRGPNQRAWTHTGVDRHTGKTGGDRYGPWMAKKVVRA